MDNLKCVAMSPPKTLQFRNWHSHHTDNRKVEFSIYNNITAIHVKCTNTKILNVYYGGRKLGEYDRDDAVDELLIYFKTPDQRTDYNYNFDISLTDSTDDYKVKLNVTQDKDVVKQVERSFGGTDLTPVISAVKKLSENLNVMMSQLMSAAKERKELSENLNVMMSQLISAEKERKELALSIDPLEKHMYSIHDKIKILAEGDITRDD